MTCMSDDALDNAIASVLRVSPDWSADPVWDPTGMVDLDGLPITEALRSDLRGWAMTWEQLSGWSPVESPVADDGPAWQKWRRHGQHLANWLQRELGEGTRVEYWL